MSLENLQKAMYDYICENNIFKKIIPFSALITVIYGIYSLIYSIGLFYTIMNLVEIVGGAIYIVSVLGLIVSFAKNDMLPILALFGLLCISYLIYAVSFMFKEYTTISLVIEYFVYALIYGYFAYIAMVRYNKSEKVVK